MTTIKEARSEYKIPIYSKIFRIIARPIFKALFHILTNVTITGKENIPKQGPYIIIYNHVSLFEPPFVLTFWPVFPEVIAATEVFQRKGQDLLVKLYHAIPVHRGGYDRILIETILSILKKNLPVAIAPEGGRSHTPGMRRAKPGISFIIEQYPVSIVPVGIEGTSDDMLKLGLQGKRPKIAMHIGEPFTLPDIHPAGKNRKQLRQSNADLAILHIAALLPRQYWGEYTEMMEKQTRNE